MNLEAIFDNKPVQFTGKSMVILMVLGNLVKFLSLMTVNEAFLLISSIVGSIFIIFKTIIAYYTMMGLIRENKARKAKGLPKRNLFSKWKITKKK